MLRHDLAPQSTSPVREYERRDKWMLDAWCTARGLPELPARLLPTIGYIVSGIAVGFLYRTDSGIAILDSYLANPLVDAPARSGALDAITAALINEARSLGFKWLKCETKFSTIELRAIRHGFKATGSYTGLFMELA